MENTSAIRQQVAHATSHHLPAAQTQQYKKAQLLTKIIWEFSGENVRRMDH